MDSPLKRQLAADRVNPEHAAQVQIEREMFEDAPPLRATYEGRGQTVEEFMNSLGLEAEQRRFAKQAISEVAADTRKALGVYRDGKRHGIDGVKLSEIIREGVIRAQERIRSLTKSRQSDPLARFHGLCAMAATHGLRVNGQWSPDEHDHSHLDALSTQIAQAAAQRAADPEPESAGEAEVDHSAHAALHGAAGALGKLEPVEPYVEAHKRLTAEVKLALKNPAESDAASLAKRVKALVRLMSHRAEEPTTKSFALDLTSGGLLIPMTRNHRSFRPPQEVATDLRDRLGVFATADRGAIRVLVKSLVPPGAVACPTGGYLLDPVTAEAWLHRAICGPRLGVTQG